MQTKRLLVDILKGKLNEIEKPKTQIHLVCSQLFTKCSKTPHTHPPTQSKQKLQFIEEAGIMLYLSINPRRITTTIICQ